MPCPNTTTISFFSSFTKNITIPRCVCVFVCVCVYTDYMEDTVLITSHV